jgi:SAM-dependent methyltransferase
MSYPERIDPDATEPGILALHLKRYEFALPFSAGAEVLDAACGAGYGAAHLAQQASKVVGLDVDRETIDQARRRYPLANVEFRVGDTAHLSDPDASFDVICSFETIEHVADPEQTLAEFARVLRPGGTLLISTPSVQVTTSSPANPFHQVEWSVDDFRALLERFFGQIELYGQRRVQTPAHRLVQQLDVLGLRRKVGFLRRGSRLLGTAATADLTLDDVVIERDQLEHASEIVAVCRSPRR